MICYHTSQKHAFGSDFSTYERSNNNTLNSKFVASMMALQRWRFNGGASFFGASTIGARYRHVYTYRIFSTSHPRDPQYIGELAHHGRTRGVWLPGRERRPHGFRLCGPHSVSIFQSAAHRLQFQ